MKHAHKHSKKCSGHHHHGAINKPEDETSKKRCAYDCKTIMGVLGIVASVVGHAGGIMGTIQSFMSDSDQNEGSFFEMPLLPVTISACVVSLIIDLMATWVHAKIDQSNQSSKEIELTTDQTKISEKTALIQNEKLTRWQQLCVAADMLGHMLDSFSALALTVAIVKPSGSIAKAVCYGISGIYATLTNLSTYRSCEAQLKQALVDTRFCSPS